MKKILIIYDTVEGQTKKISEFIWEKLRAQNFVVTLATPKEMTGSLEHYDGVIVGAPVHIQKYPKSLRKWVAQNSNILTKKPSAFFSVCLGILQKDNQEVQLEERRIAESFLVDSGWTPSMINIFGGCLAYTKYNWITKMAMKWIAKKAGGSLDTTKDHEYTDWNEVREFVLDFSKLLEPHSAVKNS